MGKSPKKTSGRVWLTITEKKEILEFRKENPDFTYRRLAVIFSEKWGKKINKCHVHGVVKNSEQILQVTGKMEKRKKLPL